MLIIGFVGDINPGEYYTSLGHGPRTCFDHVDPLAGCRELLLSCDTVVGNLEAPVTNKPRQGSNFMEWGLIGNSNSISKLKESNFGYLTLANNHSVQHGEEVFKETIKELSLKGIVPIGIKDQDLAVFEKDGISVGFIAASDVPDNTDKNQQLYQVYNQAFIEKIKTSLNKVDHLIVYLHWGEEESTVPTHRQREISEFLKGLGVRAVIGSHSHLFYSIEKKDNFVSAYSLGNFVFDLAWEHRLTKSGLLVINFDKKNISAEVTPIELHNHGCIPKISGDKKIITDKISLYDNGLHIKNQQLKKILYLLRYIYKGKTLLKLRFLKAKLTVEKPKWHLK